MPRAGASGAIVRKRILKNEYIQGTLAMTDLTTLFIDWIQRSEWTTDQLDALNAAIDALEDIEAGRYVPNVNP